VSRLPTSLQPAKLLSLTFDQPLGTAVDRGGYHLDMRVKSDGEDVWPPPSWPSLGIKLWVVRCQWALAAYEHFVHSGDERWLTAARGAADHVLESMVTDGPAPGALTHEFAFAHTFMLPVGWMSAMAQGEAASLLARVHRSTGDDRYAEGAVRVLEPIAVASAAGGCGTPWRGGWFPEEYPTEPPSLVLNGALFVLFGMYDALAVNDDAALRTRFEETLDLIAANLGAWDIGWWTRYDLFPHQRLTVSSNAYQELHINQLVALHRCVPRPEFEQWAQRWDKQRASLLRRSRATVTKVGFRLAVPRAKRGTH
jgi:hypothetical protein